MTSARSIVTHALKIIGVVGMGAPITAENSEDGLQSLNLILEQWSLMPLTIPVISREVFPLVGGQGGPSNPYTIGPNGDFDTDRPTSIRNVGLYVSSVDEPFEIVRSVYTEDAYAAIIQKELQSAYFTGMRFEPTYADQLATINLWPVPSDASTSIVLYIPKQLRQFDDLNDQYDFPPGAISALTYELARQLCPQYGQNWSQQLESMTGQFLSLYQRNNTVMVDLGLDAALISQAGVYNILSDGIQGS